MATVSIFRHFLLLLSSTLVVLVPLTFCASDYEAFMKFKKSLTNVSVLDSWVPGSKHCRGTKGHWKGLLCNNRRVTGLRLEGMGLSGNIDCDALTEIQNLYLLSVYNNSFPDTIPRINRLHSLKGLFLSNNHFSGEIPTDYFAKIRLDDLPVRSSTKAVEVSVSMLDETEVSIKSPTLSSSLKDLDHGNPNGVVSELVMVNNEKGVFGLTDLMSSSAEVLGNGSLGSSFKAVTIDGVAVVVKRMPRMNASGNDAFDAEVKRLRNVRHPNVLTPLVYHYRREERLFVNDYIR